MKCPKCQSDRVNYSMIRDRKGIMHSYAECQMCHTKWEREMITQSFADDMQNPSPSDNSQSHVSTEAEVRYGDKSRKTIITAAVIVMNVISLFLFGFFDAIIFAFVIAFFSILGLYSMWHPDKPKEQAQPSAIPYSPDMTGEEYEKLVAEKLRLEGYSDISLTDVTNDHGCDILAVNPKGVSAVIQCKRYSGSVGVHAVQEADSARNFYKRTLAIVITNSTFTSAARLHASRTNVILIENYI